MTAPVRALLPNRRRAETTEIEVGGQRVAAMVGFYPDGSAAELFLSGAKAGSGLAGILEDASVVISIALQHGVPAATLAKSIARVPETLDGPAVTPGSAIGAALDLIASYDPRQ